MNDYLKATSTLAIALAATIALANPVLAAPAEPSTPADVIHPNIHQNNKGGNANPNGNSGNGSTGGNMHGIGNTPGQEGSNPNDDGVNGFANELQTVHGGIGSKNKQALP
jgi:hypothetical protein